MKSNRDGTQRDEAIYQALRNAIVDHRLRPGARLPEDSLGRAFSVSRTSIRKVLQRLALDRLVTIRPRRGAEVSRPTTKQAADVFATRRIIECGSIRIIAEQMTGEDREALEELIDREQTARKADDQSSAIKYSADFHVRLMAVADNELIRTFVEQLSSLSSLIIAVYGSPSSVGCDCGEHDELLKLIESGNVTEAEGWMDHHLRQIEASLNFIEEREQAPDFETLFGSSAEAP